jgi:FkbM family methyltransferase
MSVEVSRRFPTATVFAFEPQTELARKINLSAQLNNLRNLRVCEVMVGETTGTGKLFLTSHCIHASAIPREENARQRICEITTLDEQVHSGRLPPPNLVKIDVEGYEWAVCRGAKQILSTFRPLILFEADENMQRFHYTRNDLVEYLQQLAPYELFFVGKDGLYPLDREMDNQAFGDFLGCPPERMNDLNALVARQALA